MRLLLIALLLTLAFVETRAEDSLPPPPSGFSWQQLPSIKSVLLKPDGWHFKQSKKGQTDGFFITKEDIDEAGAFKTGLTLNCILYVPKKSGQLPSGYAVSMADAAATKYKLIERSSSKEGPFRSLRFRYIDAPSGKESITVCQLMVANDKTGTLFLVIFEAPTASWDEAWKTGEAIFKKMLLDDEV